MLIPIDILSLTCLLLIPTPPQTPDLIGGLGLSKGGIPSVADPLPSGPGSMAATLTHDDANQTTHLVWLEPVVDDDAPAGSPSVWRVRHARRTTSGWTEPVTVTQRNDLFVNWADVPQVAVADDGDVVVSWLQKSGSGTYAYDAMVARSDDGGDSFTTLGSLHDDGTKTEHGFVSLVPEGGAIRCFWLDGRTMSTDGHGGHDQHGGGDMSIRSALVDETIGPGTLLDDRVCECCNTAAVATPHGPVVAYRDRSPHEVRDIATMAARAGQWQASSIVFDDEWGLEGCPVNGPAMDAAGELVGIAWYTGAGDDSVQVAFSKRGGAFGDPIGIAGPAALGRVDLAMVSQDLAMVSWIDAQGDDAHLRARLVSPDGSTGDVVTLARVPAGRRSGFPRIQVIGDVVLIVTTSPDRELGLAGTLVPLAVFPTPQPSRLPALGDRTQDTPAKE